MTIDDAKGKATIEDDDDEPALSIEGASVEEGDAGTTNVGLSVGLSEASSETVSVEYKTRDGSAAAGDDYEQASGTLSFAPGEAEATLTVHVAGDKVVEVDEDFAVVLRHADGAEIANGEAKVAIVDDDTTSADGRDRGDRQRTRAELDCDAGSLADDIASAIARDPDTIAGASLDELPSCTADAVYGSALGEFPRDGDTFGILVDFQFFSEEFPEYVGGSFNDAFIAELDSSTWTTSGSSIGAPDNFAFDTAGNPISINSVGPTGMTAGDAAGTTYDGATNVLSASTP